MGLTGDIKNQIVVFDVFKTLNLKIRQDKLAIDVGSVAQNLRYDNSIGEISKRTSRAKYGGMSTLGTSKIIHGDRYYNTAAGTQTQIIAFSTTIKKGTDADGTFDNIFTSLTADVHKNSLTYKDIWYFCDGTNTNGAYDATNAEDMGVPTPGSAPTVATGVPGALTGDYMYKVTFEIDGYQEGNASVASSLVQPSSDKVDLSSIPLSSNGRCTARNLYRTKAGESTYNFLIRIADNTTETLTDNTVDGSLDTTRLAPSDFGAPPKFKYMVLHKERIFGLNTDNDNGKSELVYSDIRAGTSYPDVYPAANTQPIAPDDGDIGKGVIQDNFGQLIIFKQNGIYKFNTDTDDPVGWTISEKLSPHGNAGANTASTPQGVFFITRYGELANRLMLWNGSRAEPVFEGIEPLLSSITKSAIDDVKLHYHNGLLLISLRDPVPGSIFNNTVITIDLINGGINVDRKNVAHFWSWLGDGDRGELYTGTSDSTGFVFREDTADLDLLIKLKSELDEGTYDQVESGGTEQAPTVTIVEADLADDIGAKTISAASDIISTLTDDIDTIWPGGVYTSPVLEVNALNLVKIFWAETQSGNTEAVFQIRAGDTPSATTSASWSSFLRTAGGSDISGVTAKRYIQYRVKLLTKVTTDASLISLKRGAAPDDYMAKCNRIKA